MSTATHRHVRCTGDVPRLLLAVASRTVLWSVLLLAVWAALPASLGWHVTTVVSDSMAPGIRTGDVVAAMPAGPDAVDPGRVLLVDDPDHAERLRLHRLERIEQDGRLRLRGDANPTADRTAVMPEAVLGVGVLRFPGIGLPTVWARQQSWVPIGIAVVAALALVRAARADRDITAGRPCRRCGTPRWDLGTAALTPGTGAPVSGAGGTGAPDVAASLSLSVVAAVTVLTIALAAGSAGAGFSGTTATATTLGTGTFPCFHEPAPAGSQLAWDFAEKQGDIVQDSSGHGADGRFVGDASRVDGSCAANPWSTYPGAGTDDYAVTDRPTTGPQVFSLEVWFRSADPAGGRVFGFTSDTAPASTYRDRHLYIDSGGGLRFGVQGAGNLFNFTVGGGDVADGEWHHAVATFESRSMTLYVDGQRKERRTDAVAARQYDGHWRTGRGTLVGWPDSGNFGFTGDIDSATVYDRVLDAETVATRFAAGR
ncbi:LamG-like jellyroll fold domain-containing protein [Curtobacterium sp. MCPF17_021]|uniref:LamG-like jellyroll fold domain-containing protein n=1 Tax=Curtobacterium sp. MCPF17_021 TaxID=2175639 RepID=UPI000DA71624|nr:LamG-like jellyroll fold domain-containing protein [Curtobacterium sp. MCPF17_021]WIE81893.1 LamG domain-containing protein [Curtobacterium sp. MCPF17_021]